MGLSCPEHLDPNHSQNDWTPDHSPMQPGLVVQSHYTGLANCPAALPARAPCPKETHSLPH